MDGTEPVEEELKKRIEESTGQKAACMESECKSWLCVNSQF